jgi:hypothetical protein
VIYYRGKEAKMAAFHHRGISSIPRADTADETIIAVRAKRKSEAAFPGGGAADLVVKFSSGTKWAVQVKNGVAAPLPTMRRQKSASRKKGATAVIAWVGPKGITYTSARTGRKMTPPRRRR